MKEKLRKSQGQNIQAEEERKQNQQERELPHQQGEPLFDIYLRGRMHSGSMLPHFHFYHQILLITRGSAKFIIEGRQYLARERSLLIISAFERHALEVTEYPYDGYVLAINNEFARRYLARPYLNSALLCRPEGISHMVELSEEAFPQATGLCRQMVDELQEGRPLWDEQEAALTMQLMTLVYRENPEAYWSSQNNRADELIYAAQQYVAAHYMEDITLESVAGTLYISKYYLSHLFKKMTGYSYRDYLLQYRLSAAKQQLIQTQISVGQIALACGWTDANQFSRIFRQNEGCSPREYRIRWQEKG